jgi:hypothetical protein
LEFLAGAELARPLLVFSLLHKRYRDAVIQKLIRLPIATDPDTNQYAWTTTLQLAEVQQLTVYDAS